MEQRSDHQPSTLLLACLIAAVVFVAIAPTLTWLEFSGGSENLNIGTILEIRRGGPWLVPTLKGEPRTLKPPLTAWITAMAVSPDTIRSLSNSDPHIRANAFKQMAWDARSLSLIAACLMLVAVYELGRTIGDERLGLTAALVCASTTLFLRYGRASTTDIQLALWVSVANAFLAKAILRGKIWSGCIVAGLAIGLGLMSKGPVALAQTIAPALLFAVLFRWNPTESNLPKARSYILPALAGLVAMLAIALPWPIVVMRRVPDVMHTWYAEMMHGGEHNTHADPWYSYAILVASILPWSIFWIAGLMKRIGEGWRGAIPIDFAICLVIVPILLMMLSTDKKERYLLPMCGPCAIIAAYGALPRHGRTLLPSQQRLLEMLHWTGVGILLIGFPIAGAVALKSMDGEKWFSMPLGITTACAGAILLTIAIVLHRRRPSSLAIATFVMMLALNALIAYGYRTSVDGSSEMRPLAEKILQDYPTAAVGKFDPQSKPMRTPTDLNIYLNRVVPIVNNPATFGEENRPTVLIVPQREKSPATTMPTDWTEFATIERDGDRWHAFVRMK